MASSSAAGGQSTAPTGLKVEIKSAEGLPRMDPNVFGGKSDPYCICRIKRKSQELRTKTISNELNPKWGHVGHLVDVEKSDELIFSVYDEDAWPKADDFLGEAVLPLAPVLDKGFDGDLKLQNGPGKTSPKLSVRVIPEHLSGEEIRKARLDQLGEIAQHALRDVVGDRDEHDEDIHTLYAPAFDGVMPQALIFSGGGTKGIVYAGAVKRLEKELKARHGDEKVKLTSSIRQFAGTSAGSQAAALLACGCSGEQFERVMMRAPWEKLFDKKFACCWPLDIVCCLPCNLCSTLRTYGFYKGKFLESYLNKLFEREPEEGGLGRKPDGGKWTFQDLQKQGIELKLGVTNITTKKFEFLSAETHPDMPISLAATASSSIPFVFPPVEWNGNQYVDGGLEGNLPLCAFKGSKCIAFAFASSNSESKHAKPNKPLSGGAKFPEYLGRIISRVWNSMQDANGYDKDLASHYEAMGVDIVSICTGTAGPLDTNMKPEQLNGLVENGYKALDDYFKAGSEASVVSRRMRGLLHTLRRNADLASGVAGTYLDRVGRQVSHEMRARGSRH